MSGEPVVRDHLLLEDGGKLILEEAVGVGYLMLESSVISSLSTTNDLTKPIDFAWPERWPERK